MTTPDGLTAEALWQGRCQDCAHEDEAHDPWCGVIVGSDGGVMPEPRHCNCITHESVARHVAAAVARHVRETGCEGLREALRRHIVALGELCELVTRHEDATECGCGDFDDWFQAWDGPAQRLHVPDDVMAEARAALASPATEEVEP